MGILNDLNTDCIRLTTLLVNRGLSFSIDRILALTLKTSEKQPTNRTEKLHTLITQRKFDKTDNNENAFYC